jgi:hypothetical protein
MTAPLLITFNKRERERLAAHCQAMGIRFDEFVHDAAMQACDEMDGVQRDLRRAGAVEASRVIEVREELRPYTEDADIRVRSLAQFVVKILDGHV